MQKRLCIFKELILRWICLILFIFFVQSSCKRNKYEPAYPVGSNENINTWILDSLKRYYYWNETLPFKPNISVAPRDFFTSVLNLADRFSYLVFPNSLSTYPANNKNFGFDYSTILEQSTKQVIGIIKLVLKDSPASRAGLKRGDYIRKINGQQLTEANAVLLQQEILKGNRFSLGLAELMGDTWTDTRSVEISSGVVLDQKESSKIIESVGKKIGYLYFENFNSGLANALNTVFANFKTAGISDLILDLRYNGGGQVSEAAGVCTLIAGLSYDKPFITYKGNKNGGTRTESIGSAATFDGTVNFNKLLQNSLRLTKIYILSTGATASASEVIINNLKPYIQVVLIGQKTKGKDEASFKIFDNRQPKLVEWEMHPIIYKLFNAAGNGAYSAGISPDININELKTLPLLPFGDVNDPLVHAALSSAVTGKTSATLASVKQKKSNIILGNVITDTHLRAAENNIVITHR